MWILTILGFLISIAFLIALLHGYKHHSVLMAEIGLAGGAFFLLFSLICLLYAMQIM